MVTEEQELVDFYRRVLAARDLPKPPEPVSVEVSSQSSPMIPITRAQEQVPDSDHTESAGAPPLTTVYDLFQNGFVSFGHQNIFQQFFRFSMQDNQHRSNPCYVRVLLATWFETEPIIKFEPLNGLLFVAFNGSTFTPPAPPNFAFPAFGMTPQEHLTLSQPNINGPGYYTATLNLQWTVQDSVTNVFATNIDTGGLGVWTPGNPGYVANSYNILFWVGA